MSGGRRTLTRNALADSFDTLAVSVSMFADSCQLGDTVTLPPAHAA
jgi:hypothetical protein